MNQTKATDGVEKNLNTVFSIPTNAIIFAGILTVGLVADLTTKTYVFTHFYDSTSAIGQPVYWWVDGIFGIQPSTNPGALFGLGAGYQWFFAALSFVFLSIVLIWLFRLGGIQDRWLSFCFGMISGGILGNLYDRLGLGHGFGLPLDCRRDVRDWILFRLQGVPMFDPWPNFNIADSLLVVGAIMLFVHGLRSNSPQNSETSHADR